MGVDLYTYDGRRAVVLGGASGIGRATAELVRDLGAETTVVDHVDADLTGVKSLHLDLRDSASIDEALAQVSGAVDALFCCAGVAAGSPGLDTVNFVGQRHVVQGLLADGRLGAGSAVGMISSLAGYGWERKIDVLLPYLETASFDDAVAWGRRHPEAITYAWTKMAVCAFVAQQSYPLRKVGSRINSIMPGPTDTPLARANADVWLRGLGQDYRDATETGPSTPEEQAAVLAFLCSPAATHVNGVNMLTDGGYVSSAVSGSFDPSGLNWMLGR